MSGNLSLREAKVGSTYTVKKIGGSGPVRRRIMDMGITKEAEVFIRKVAPLGDPVQICVRNYELSIRKADADLIEVMEVTNVQEGDKNEN